MSSTSQAVAVLLSGSSFSTSARYVAPLRLIVCSSPFAGAPAAWYSSPLSARRQRGTAAAAGMATLESVAVFESRGLVIACCQMSWRLSGPRGGTLRFCPMSFPTMPPSVLVRRNSNGSRQAMVAGLGSFGSNAADCCSAHSHYNAAISACEKDKQWLQALGTLPP